MSFTASDGALRAHLDEQTWSSLLSDADVSGDEDARAAARLAATAPVRLQVRSWAGDRAVVANLGATHDSAAGAARVSVVEDGRAVPTEGVELSVFTPERLALEVLRLLPPDATPVTHPDGSDLASALFVLPVEAALVMSRALREQDLDVAREAAELAGLDDVPPLLESLSASLRADATVTVLVGDQVVALRRWLQCHLGWAEVALTPDGVLHAPVDREGVLASVVTDVVAAWEQALAATGGAA